MVWEHSCGAVIFSRGKEGLRYLIIQMQDGHHGFPKGHMEPGETEWDTARREILEEVGIEPILLAGFREEERYLLPGKRNTGKRVTCFLAEFEEQPVRIQPEEVLSAQLLSFDEAWETLEHMETREILKKAHSFLQKEKQ